ncbi:MAG: DUF6531 domain-containing protein, partial [Kiritimatiellaeota bacterium]|nr:DUF6531 domain-containing protein [Kiritimatiellota bacterium]
MPSGAFTDTATDLAVTRTAPLAWTRRYDSRLRNTDGSFGRGWTPPYDASLTLTADPDAVIAARGSPDAVIPTALATAVVDDLLAAQYPDVTAGERAKRMMVAAHAVQWWTRQLTAAAATVDLDGRALTFTRRPDGVWA